MEIVISARPYAEVFIASFHEGIQILRNKPVETQSRVCSTGTGWSAENIGMMGSQTSGQKRLFYSFNLEDHIPPDHLLRGIDLFLDLDSLRDHLAPLYSHTGRPSIDPELMVRMLIVGATRQSC